MINLNEIKQLQEKILHLKQAEMNPVANEHKDEFVEILKEFMTLMFHRLDQNLRMVELRKILDTSKGIVDSMLNSTRPLPPAFRLILSMLYGSLQEKIENRYIVSVFCMNPSTWKTLVTNEAADIESFVAAAKKTEPFSSTVVIEHVNNNIVRSSDRVLLLSYPDMPKKMVE